MLIPEGPSALLGAGMMMLIDGHGDESHVTLTVAPTTSGARLTPDHRGLPDDESATNYNDGWTWSLRKLERVAC